MPALSLRRLSPVAVGLVGILALAGVAPAAHATTTQTPAPSFAAFEASPSARSPIAANATIVNVRIDPMGPLAFADSGLRLVQEPGIGLRLEVFKTSTGEVGSAVDLTGRVDSVAAVTHINDYDNDQRLEVFVRGSLGGQARLIRVIGVASDSLAGASIDEPASGAVDPTRLVLLDAASSGLLAVHRTDSGAFTAQRVSYGLEPVRDPVTLPLPVSGERVFAMSPDSGTLFSVRQGAVDAVSIYDPSTVRSVELAGFGPPRTVSVDGSLLMLADTTGRVALVGTDASGTPVPRLSVELGAVPRALDIKDGFDELQVATADGHTIRRFPTNGGDERTARTFEGLSIVEGSLASGRWYQYDSSFIATVGQTAYRYTDAYLLAPVPAVASLSSPERVGAGLDWSISAYATGDVDATWEYSLDGGAHWANRGAEWSSAVNDAPTSIRARPALPSPMDGLAPYYRTENAGVPLAWTNFGRTEYDVSLPASGYGALWRPRFSNDLGTVVGPTQTISIAGAPEVDSAPAITRHPASARVFEAGEALFQATATGDPEPTVAWERSVDGVSWTSVPNATQTSLRIVASLADDGSRYRAVFSSTRGTATSEAALLSVSPVPAPHLGAAPSGAVAIGVPVLSFDLSDYAGDWRRVGAGTGVEVPERGFRFSEGTGWRDPATGAFQAAWHGAAMFRPYGGLNGLHITFTNPYLAIDGTGRGTLTAQVSWNNGGGMGGTQDSSDSGGSRRVVVATFVGAAAAAQADGTFRFSHTPEWSGRPYIKPGLADARTYDSSFPASFVDYLDDALRPWFLTTGSSRDPEKAPREIAATFAATTAPASGEGAPVSATDPLDDGAQHFADAAPVITTQPAAVTAQVGASATLRVGTSGVPAPTVKWQRLDGTTWADIPGATTSVLRVEGVTEGVQTLRAVASNRVGSVESDTVTLVGEPPRPEPSAGDGSSDPEPAKTPAPTVGEGALLTGLPQAGVTATVAGRTLVVSGLSPASWFHAYAYSVPTALGWHRSSATGSFTLELPGELAAGPHRVTLQDANGAFVGWAEFQLDETSPSAVSVVPGRRLAATGGPDASVPVAWALALLALGTGLVLSRRAWRHGASRA